MNSNLQVGYRAIWFSRMRICFIFVLAFGATPCVHARQPQIDELTNNVVEELIKTHEKAVVVFDFVGPDKKSTALGQKIADDFRDALTKSTAAFNVIDPAQITQALETNRVSPQILREPELELWLGKKLGTGIAILGELERDGENLNILVDTYQADGRPIDEFQDHSAANGSDEIAFAYPSQQHYGSNCGDPSSWREWKFISSVCLLSFRKAFFTSGKEPSPR
ncbi:MAG: hypothetical protein ABSF40_14340 [Candidatus Acidiferrales bacterium]|jgi:hypothetical protein